MPKPYEQIAVWAKGCALQAQAGLSLVDIIESSECFRAGKRARVAERLRAGKPLPESLMAFYPDLSASDISLLNAANRVGQLPRGFELLSAQYFLRAQVQSLVFSAFFYPLGLIYIGIFLISLQALLYQESTLESEAVAFATRIGLFSLAVYSVKKLVTLRPPVMSFLLRVFPPIRSLSRSLAYQRLVWVLREGSVAALPVQDTFQLAGESCGTSKSMKKVNSLLQGLSRGTDFGSLFLDFCRLFPKSQRVSVAVSSPFDMPPWAVLLMRKFDQGLEKGVFRIRQLSKPIALVLLSPILFWLLQYLWTVMGRELLERLQSVLG